MFIIDIVNEWRSAKVRLLFIMYSLGELFVLTPYSSRVEEMVKKIGKGKQDEIIYLGRPKSVKK